MCSNLIIRAVCLVRLIAGLSIEGELAGTALSDPVSVVVNGDTAFLYRGERDDLFLSNSFGQVVAINVDDPSSPSVLAFTPETFELTPRKGGLAGAPASDSQPCC